MKADFTDIHAELEKARRVNEKNRYVFPSDKNSLYKEIRISGHPCLIIRSRKTENKKDRALLFIYGDTAYPVLQLGAADNESIHIPLDLLTVCVQIVKGFNAVFTHIPHLLG